MSTALGLGLGMPFQTRTGVDAYAVGGVSPATVADFNGTLNDGTEYYRVNGSETTFGSMFTHSRTSNATMFDSDGLLKWAPHNLALHSDAIATGFANITNATLTADQGTDPDGLDADLIAGSSGTGNIRTQQSLSGFVVGETCRWTIRAKKSGANGTWIFIYEPDSNVGAYFNLDAGTKGTEVGSPSATISDATNGWYDCTINFTVADSTPRPNLYIADGDNDLGIATIDSTYSVLFTRHHIYRNSLGGMVDNPNTSSSYVPTTTAAVYGPRRNNYRYNGSTWVNKGILIEPTAATNLMQPSNNFSTNNTPLAVTVAQNATGPDGETSAWTVTATAGSGRHGGYQSRTSTASSPFTDSIFAKAGTVQYLAIACRSTSGTTGYTALVDLSDGTVVDTNTIGTPTGTRHPVEELENGWYRISVSFDAPTNATYWEYGMADSASPTYTAGLPSFNAAGTETVLVYGAQAEAGALSSYMPTITTSTTRALETLTIAAANMAASTTAMSFHVKGEMSYADNDDGNEAILIRWYDDLNNQINWTLDTSVGGGTGRILFQQADGGTFENLYSPANGFTPDINVSFNIASRNTSTAMNGAISGTALTADTTPTTLNSFTSNFELGYDGVFNIELFRQDDSDWGDTGIEEAST